MADAAAVDPTRGARQLFALPALLVAAYGLAFVAGRAYPDGALGLLALLAPLAAILAFPAAIAVRDAGLARQLLLFGAWLGWACLGLLIHPTHAVIGTGWLGTACASGAALLAVASSGADPRRALLAVAAWSGVALLVAGIGQRLGHDEQFGMGNINYLLECCGPPLWAAGAALAAQRLLGRRPSGREVLLVAVALALLLALGLSFSLGPRRGMLLGGLAGWGLAGVSLLARRWPRATAAATTLAVAGCALAAWALWPRIYALIDPHTHVRSDRWYMYRAGLERAAETWALGGGAYAALDLHRSLGEYARHWSAVGHWTLSLHCAPLDALLDGGVVALGLWLAMAANLVHRVLRIADPALRAGMLALTGALGVHALTSNTYTTPLGQVLAGMLLGLVFLAPTAAAPAARPADDPRWPRRLAIALGVAGALVAFSELPIAVLGRTAPATAVARAMAWSRVPEPIALEFIAAVPLLLEPRDRLACAELVSTAQQRLGDMYSVRFSRTLLASLLEQDAQEQVRRGVPLAGETMALVARDSLTRDQDLARLLPFRREIYAHLQILLRRHADLAGALDPALARRMDWAAGTPGLPPPPLEPALATRGGIDAAADRAAALLWYLQQGPPTAIVRDQVVDLVLAYGDVPDVAFLGMQLVVADWPDSAPALARMTPALQLGFATTTMVTQQATLIDQMARRTGGGSAGLTAALAAVYPAVWSRWNAACRSAAGASAFSTVGIPATDPLAAAACARAFAHQAGLQPEPEPEPEPPVSR